MPYDPFHVAASNEDEATTKQAKLVAVRRPPICSIPLTKLEWGAVDGSHRKRHRNEQHQSTNDARRPQQGGITENQTREVIRIVEKVVVAEPKTVMGVPPLVDDRVRYVVNFILEHVNSANVEIEAKFGTLIEKSSHVRVINCVPVLCETPISYEANKDTYFKSEVGNDIFAMLNSKLNARVEATEQSSSRVQYLHTQEMDVYWPGKVRETKVRRNTADGSEHYETIRIQSKKRLGDLNVLCPNKYADIRYSASREQDCSIPPNSKPQRCRIKDRISYKYEYLSIDITCVEMQGEATADNTNSFEVEVEIDPSANLYEEVLKYRRQDEASKLFDIACSLVNTVRLLLEE